MNIEIENHNLATETQAPQPQEIVEDDSMLDICEVHFEEECTPFFFKCSDDVVLETTYKIACESLMIKDQFAEDEEDLPTRENAYVLNYPSETVKTALTYCALLQDQKPQEIEKPLKGPLKECIGGWEYEFLEKHCFVTSHATKEDNDQASAMIVAPLLMIANFLNVPSLIDLGAATIASFIKGKSPEQIRALLGIEDDLSEEDKKKIEADNQWVTNAQ